MTVNKVTVLPPDIASKIAAGEVVQRPASVVKELVDNALDAGASRVEIEIDEGGKDRIAVIDNGVGMSKEDVEVSIERHATSKIQSAEDLDCIMTLGFRGEALASISAVSRFSITSRSQGQSLGTKMTVDERGVEIGEAGCPEGTSIEAADLFYNVPARRKFLKSVQTECGVVLETVVRQALAFEKVHFILTHNGRKANEFPRVSTREERVRQILGKGVSEHLIAVRGETTGGSLEGYVSLPTEHRRNAGLIYVLVNDRYVQDRLLLRALLDPYRTLLPSGRYPIGVLYLSLPPETIDVNVHPAKLEIRFHDEDRAFHLVRGSVQRALTEFNGQTLSDSSTKPQTPEMPPENQPEKSKASQLEEKIRTAVDAFGERMATLERQQREGVADAEPPPIEPPPEIPPYESGPPASVSSGPRQETFASAMVPQTLFGGGRTFHPRMQLSNTYILGQVEGESDLIIIDQHAAHERIVFERLQRQRNSGALPSQSLLIPLTWDVAPGEVDRVRGNLDAMRLLGFEIEYFGGETFNVTAIPVALDLERSAELLRDSISEISQRGRKSDSYEPLETALLERLACHTAVRAGQSLSHKEMEAITSDLVKTPNAGTCPHGRPTTLRITDAELRKHFKRTV